MKNEQNTIAEPRFVKTTHDVVGEEKSEFYNTEWWLDTARPIKEYPGFIAVETYEDKDPNNFVKCIGMRNLFTDQAEYYHVCAVCYNYHSGQQWTGSTRMNDYRQRSEADLKTHQETKGWCEFCDPIFGNGGWSD